MIRAEDIEVYNMIRESPFFFPLSPTLACAHTQRIKCGRTSENPLCLPPWTGDSLPTRTLSCFLAHFFDCSNLSRYEETMQDLCRARKLCKIYAGRNTVHQLTPPAPKFTPLVLFFSFLVTTALRYADCYLTSLHIRRACSKVSFERHP